jgi:hypothetical protein
VVMSYACIMDVLSLHDSRISMWERCCADTAVV